MMFETFIFDLGKVGVGYDDLEFIARLNAYIAGSPLGPDCLDGAMGSFMESFNRGGMDAEEFRQAIVRAYFARGDRIPDAGEFYAAYAQVLTPDRQVMDLWRRLLNRGKTLVALSNIDPLRHRECRRLGIFEYFHLSVLSYAEMEAKPSKRLLRLALERSGTRPEEAFYVDDMAVNLFPARELGIVTHHFRCLNGLYKDLRRHGVMVG